MAHHYPVKPTSARWITLTGRVRGEGELEGCPRSRDIPHAPFGRSEFSGLRHMPQPGGDPLVRLPGPRWPLRAQEAPDSFVATPRHPNWSLNPGSRALEGPTGSRNGLCRAIKQPVRHSMHASASRAGLEVRR